MARPDKAGAVAELAAEFRGSSAVVLTEYRGLSVKQLTELRRALGSSASYAIVKNTLTKIAAQEAGVEGIEAHLVGPSAIAFVKGDPVEAAKGLRDFARGNPRLVIKGAVVDGRPLSAADIGKLADLESREVLLAKLAGAMTASLSQAAALFAAPLGQAVRLVEALRQQAQDASAAGVEAPPADTAEPDPVVAEAASEPPAPEAPAPDQPAPDQPAPDQPSAPEPLAPDQPAPAENPGG